MQVQRLTRLWHRYLGLFDSEVEAAIAYDREAVRQKGAMTLTYGLAFFLRSALTNSLHTPGLDACTNFELSRYASNMPLRAP